MRLLAIAFLVALSACAEPVPVPTPDTTPMSAEDALATARAAVPEFAALQPGVQMHMTAEELHRSVMAEDVPADREVWYFAFHNRATSRGAIVIVDFFTGRVLEVIRTIS